MLAACAGGAVDLHLDVLGADVHLNGVVQLGHDLQRGKAGLTAGVGIEGRDAHQTVDAVLALEQAVGVGALDHHGSALHAGLVAVLIVQHLHGHAVGLCPLVVHPVEHLGPVLRLGAAGTGVEGQALLWSYSPFSMVISCSSSTALPTALTASSASGTISGSYSSSSMTSMVSASS